MKRKRILKKHPTIPMTNNANLIELRAAGGVLYQSFVIPFKVLLIRRNGYWDLPKGKLEKGESIEECALREVKEEVGAQDLSIKKYLCDTYHTYIENGKKYGKTTSWYAMEFNHPEYDFMPQQEEGITEVVWADIQEAKKMVQFDNLVNVLNQL